MKRSQRFQKIRCRSDRGQSGLRIEQLEARRLLVSNLLDFEYVAGEILVQYSSQSTRTQKAAALEAIGGEIAEVIQTRAMQDAGMGRMERITIGTGKDIAQALEAIRSNPAVLYAEPNYIYRPTVVSNDTYYMNGSLWGMYSDDSPSAGPSGTTNLFGSQAEKVWAQNLTGSSSVFIGVIDEGIQIAHPDLVDNVWVNPFEIAGDGIDNDGNGYKDDVYGWDFDGNNNSVYDGVGDDHGTHVAGTIGAKGGNATGVAGVNWSVKMISAKFLGSNGGTTANAVKAIDYLTDLKRRHGLNIVASSNSWGGGGYSQALHDAIIRHAKQNILFVAAAGNGTSNNDNVAMYPSSYDTSAGTSTETAASYDSVISVASITSTGAISSFSNYGATTVDIGAPGSGVWSTVPSNTYAAYSGTSMATPHVSGAIALYASSQTGPVSALTIKNAILTSATPTPSLNGKTVTGGRLNVYAAINQAPDQTPPQITGVAASAGSFYASFDWVTNELATTELLYGTDPENLNRTYYDPTLLLTHSASIPDLTSQTTYYFQVRSRDSVGNTTTSTLQSFTTTAIPSILFVDDDFGANFNTYYTTALTANGYSFETWNVDAFQGATPSTASLNNYQVVIWNTGAEYLAIGSGLAAAEQSAITGYLDAGGRIFISGQDVLYNTVTPNFQQNYLKVASYTHDVQRASHIAAGVEGHPISNGLSLPIASPVDFGSIYVDAVTPVSGAQGWLNHGVTSSSPFSAVSYQGDYNNGGFGIVFTTTPFESISTSAANPNNQVSVMQRVIDFLRPNIAPTDIQLVSSDWLSEGNASNWIAWADGSSASVSNNTEFVKQGESSLKLDTQGGFDTGIRYRAPAANWDLSAIDAISFWVYGDTPSPAGWQGNQPVLTIFSPTGSLTLTPSQQLMPNRSWAQLTVPLSGDSIWQRSTQGTFDITNVSMFEIHQDTWDYGFVSYYDGIRFADLNLPDLVEIPENAGVNAMVGNLSSVDSDYGEQFTYSLVAGDGSSDNAAFNISGSTLRANSSFDFETKSSYSVRIRTTDRGGLFKEKAYVVNVVDINEDVTLTGTSGNDAFVAAYTGDGTTSGHQWSVTRNGVSVFSGAIAKDMLVIDGVGGTDSLQIVGGGLNDIFQLWEDQVSTNGTITHFSNIETLRIAGGSGNDELTVNDAAPVGISRSFDGGLDVDAVKVVSGSNTWSITGSGIGNLNASSDLSWTTVESLVGGSGADLFVFGASGRLAGMVLGGAGIDTLNFSAKTTAHTVNLELGTSTSTGGIGGIENLIGGSGPTTIDVLIGANSITHWTVHGLNTGSLNSSATGSVSFTGFESLTGGIAADTFTLTESGSLSRTLSGGNATGVVDTLDLSAKTSALDFQLNTSNSVPGSLGAYTGIEQITSNSVAGSKVTRVNNVATTWVVNALGQIVVSGMTYSGPSIIAGGPSTDTIRGPAIASTWNIHSANGGSLSIPGATLNFTGIENLTGSTSTDSFIVGIAGSLSGTLNAGSGVDSLDLTAKTDALDFQLNTANTIPGVLGTFTGFERIAGNGVAGSKVTRVNSVTTAWGINALKQIIVSSMTYSGVNTIAGGPGVDTLTGPALDSAWTISSANGGSVAITGDMFAFTGIENLSGGTASDEFEIHPSGSLDGALNGGTGTGINSLSYAPWTTGVTVNLSLSTTGNSTAISGLTSNIQMVTGGLGDDTLTGRASRSTILIGLSGNDQLTAGSERDLLFGGAGADTLQSGSGDDLLISGTTTYDTNRAAILQIYSEWISTRTFAQRTANIWGNGTGTRSNGTIFLNNGGEDAIDDTVFADSDVDSLTGGLNQDWFFALASEVSDLLDSGTTPDRRN